jgi:hypothetical protein
MTPRRSLWYIIQTIWRGTVCCRFRAVRKFNQSVFRRWDCFEIWIFESQYHWKVRGLGSYKRHYSLWWIITQIQKRVKAQDIWRTKFFLEKLDFKTTDTKNWRVLYKVAVSEENSTKIIEEKIKNLCPVPFRIQIP